MSSPRQGYLARWIPAILVVAFLVDAAFHFVRLDFLAFRGDEAVSQGVPLGQRFEAGRQYRHERTSGDIASLGNLPEHRTFRSQVFTTDGLGFRNTPEDAARRPSVVLLGTSFTIGTGNSDDQTLPRRLEAISGCPAYNAGGWTPVAEDARDLVRRLGVKDGLVLLEVLERDAWGPPIAIERRRPRFRYSPLVWWYYNQASQSRLKIIAQRLYKSLCNDRILPNTYRPQVAVRKLADGRSMLFIRDIEHRGPLPDVGPHLVAIERLRDGLRQDGHRLGVYLVPDKLTVYRDLLRDRVPDADQGSRMLAALEGRLRDRGIPAVNLEPRLHAAAGEAFARGELIYWPDDTHWNPRGIEIAAGEISRGLDVPAACRERPAGD